MFRVLAAVILVLAALGVGEASADVRIALLIGNKSYSKSIGPLENPHNDVRLVAAALERNGFKRSDIRILYDQGRAQIRRAVREHARRVDRAGRNAIGFFYYTGHGAADLETRTNYLIPVDVTSRDEEIWDDSVPLHYIINRLQKNAGNAAHFVIFDACRNELQLAGRKTAEKGFVPEAARPGMLIAYATDQGSTASDAGDGSGPYAAALVAELDKPGRTAGALFDAVKFRVYQQTVRPKQLPWHVSKFTRPVTLAPLRSSTAAETKPAISRLSRPEPSKRVAPVPNYDLQTEIAFWDSVKDSNDVTILGAYLEKYPNGHFAPLARALIDKHKIDDRQTRTASLNEAASPDVERLQERQLVLAVQDELKRLGCYRGRVDGKWGRKSRSALAEALGGSTQQTPTKDVLERLKSVGLQKCAKVVERTPEVRSSKKPANVAKPSSRSGRQKRSCMTFTECVAKHGNSNWGTSWCGGSWGGANLCK